MSRGKAIGSMVCGIIAVLLWPLAIILGPIAIVLGISVLRRKHDGRGMAIAGIITGSFGFFVMFIGIALLAYFGVLTPETFEPQQPAVIVDTGFVLDAGDTKPSRSLDAGTYEIEIRSTDGLTIMTYASTKDMQLHQAGSDGAEAYHDCSATKSTRFSKTCLLADGAVVAVTNPNFLQSINVDVTITKVG